MMSVAGPPHLPTRSPDAVVHAHKLGTPLTENLAPANPLLAAPSSQLSRAGSQSLAARAPVDPTPSAAPALDVATLLRHTVVRDLIRENEGMLMELAGLRETEKHWCGTQLRLVALEESAARAELKAAESIARGVWVTRAHAFLAAYVQQLEQQLTNEAAEAAELRGFAELAQAQLARSSQPSTQGVALEKDKYRSPPTKAQRGSRIADVDTDSQRASLEEITNVRGSVKRLRSVESSDGGSTPLGPPRRTSSSQKSPGALTKVRKTIH
ncbi:hypothetical protein Q4I28_001481 [Leishmania naiffi]|uniref:Uncharacterized protein n=1 Tax=Leishmania naiffi TaxID=5678 RepID=A0AAW3C6W4_9TRYP